MKLKPLIAAGATAALLVVPMWGAAAAHEGAPPSAHAKKAKSDTPGPSASASTKAKAYGQHCQYQSKKHVKGQKGTPFSQCVTAMAKIANGDVSDPKVACKSLSKKHVKGQKGTPYSRCVVAAVQLKKEQKQEQESTAKS